MKRLSILLAVLSIAFSCKTPPTKFDTVVITLVGGETDTIGVNHKGLLCIDRDGNLEDTWWYTDLAKGVTHFSIITDDKRK